MAFSVKRKSNPEGKMALGEHLRELRKRLVKALIALLIGCVIGFLAYRPVLDVLARPIADMRAHGRNASLNFDGVATSFDLMIQTALFIGLIVSSPVWLYQVWAFIVPGLKKKERRYALSFIAVSVPLFILGVAAAYVILPSAVLTLTGFAPLEGYVSNVITASTYLVFVMRLMLAFGLAFVLPVLLVGLNLLGVLRGKTILKSWRITVFVICLFSALVTPGGDAMTMFAMAVPLLVLFGLSIVISLWHDKRKDRRLAKEAEEIESQLSSNER